MSRATWLKAPAGTLTPAASAANGGVVIKDGTIVELVAGEWLVEDSNHRDYLEDELLQRHGTLAKKLQSA